MKRVSASCPSTVGWVLPATITDTWPWLLMVSEVEFCGMVMPGCTTLPCAVTIRPWASIWNEPSRE